MPQHKDSLKRRLFKTGRKYFLAACVKVPSLRKVRYLRWAKLGRKYNALAKKTPLNEKSVVFECFNGKQFTCSPRAIYTQMLQDPRFDDWTFYWSFKIEYIDAVKNDPLLQRATLVVRGSDDYYHAFASSKYWIQNNRVPEYVTPKANQVYVQTWHGTPLKRLGADIPRNYTGGALNTADELANRFRMDSEKWTYLLSPSDYTGQRLADAFSLPENRRAKTILKEGYPRNDIIRRTLEAPDADAQVTALKQGIGSWLDERGASEGFAQALASGKKLLLYAPTFRDDQFTPGVGYSLSLDMDLQALKEAMGDEWVVLLRLHYYVANRIDLSGLEGFAFDVSEYPDINELYIVSDALCTDYSSVFFDYSNTGRPIFFLWCDFEHYGSELHGFYFDPMTLPGPKCMSSEEFTEAFKHVDSWHEDYGEEYKKFQQEFCPLDDGHAAERVIERVIFNK